MTTYNMQKIELVRTTMAETTNPNEELNLILHELSVIDFSINTLQTFANNVKESGTGLRQEETRLRELLEKVKSEIAEHLSEWHKAVDKVNEEKQRQSDLLRRKAELLKLLGAQERLKALEGKLADVIANYPQWNTLFEYQKEDVQFIVGAFDLGKSGVLNANGMGLGKTAITTASLKLMEPLFVDKFGKAPAILWLTKKSLVKSSLREIKKWDANRNFLTLDMASNPDQRNQLVELAVANGISIICNYEATNTTPALKQVEWDIVVIDEVHRLKGGANPTPTQIWKNARDIVRKAKFFLPLSGTPIANHPKDVWAYLHLFDPIRFDNLKKFERTFCYGYEIGLLDAKKLIEIMKDQTIRREKHEVENQLPDLSIETRYVDMEPEQREIYDTMKQNFFAWLDKEEGETLNATAVIAQLTRLRQISIIPSGIEGIECNESGKINEAMEIIEQLTAEGEQVVVFTSQFNEPLFELKRRCTALGITCETMTGSTSNRTEEFERAFQNGEIQVLAINMATGSEGLNLQRNPNYWSGGASNAIFLDQWWSPTRNQQGIDRIHRTGQTQACTVYVLQSENSVDAYIQSVLDEKENLIHSVMDSSELRKGKDWKDYLSKLI